ncbi:type II toxin-antitoxin system Phd/YefM family antitoxin [Lacticaseibacillus yichunensis]|nr:type II toxin-antitoxin system Phd/YefM family antitoxin [Lacticaseibacillus yichunensis]
METYTPTNLRKNLFEILSQVSEENKSYEITLKQPSGPNKGVIMISKERYEQLEELDFLEKTGTLDMVLERMAKEKPDDFTDSDAY